METPEAIKCEYEKRIAQLEKELAEARVALGICDASQPLHNETTITKRKPNDIFIEMINIYRYDIFY